MTVGTCSGCDKQAQLTKEHLISLPIGRVVLRNRNKELTTKEMRAKLPTGYFRLDVGGRPAETKVPDLRLDGYIENILCADCNGGWAIDLEEHVGPMLYKFVHLKGHLKDVNTLKRWMAFFAIKGAFYYQRTEALAENGPYHPLLGKISRPEVAVEFPLYVARLDVRPKRWQFSYVADPLVGEWPVMLWIHFWGVLFVLAIPGSVPRVPMSDGVEGLRFIDTVVIRKRDIHKLAPPIAPL